MNKRLNSLLCFRIPWLDRESLAKKMERLQKENLLLQHKIDECNKKEYTDCKDNTPVQDLSLPNYQVQFCTVDLVFS